MLELTELVDAALVVTVPMVTVVVVVFAVVDEKSGSQMLKNQNVGSIIGADSGPTNSSVIDFSSE
jgi:hypothetical protein